jgi:hypothetical protein
MRYIIGHVLIAGFTASIAIFAYELAKGDGLKRPFLIAVLIVMGLAAASAYEHVYPSDTYQTGG